MKKNFKILIYFIAMIGFCVFLVSCRSSQSKSKVSLGMTETEVKAKLGEPDDTNSSIWYYFDSSFAKKYKEIQKLIESDKESDWNKAEKLYDELENMSYTFTMISFDSEKKVSEIYFDKNHKYEEMNDYATHQEKELKNVSLSETKEIQYYIDNTVSEGYIQLISNESDDLFYTANFKDGSYYIAYLTSSSTKIENDKAVITWKDKISSYEVSIKATKIGEIDKDGTTLYLSIDKDGNIDYSLAKLNNITSVIIPNGATSIGEYAFCNCHGLTSIIIPNSVTSIGNGAFLYCGGLTSIIIPDSVTSIGESAFEDCSSLTSITIPNSVTSIGEAAFSGCRSLTSIVIPNSVTSIGEAAFEYCSSLTSIAIPNSVTTIGNRAFSFCSSLVLITVDKNNIMYKSNIGGVECNAIIENATNILICGCKNTTISSDIVGIGDYAFFACELTSIMIPNSVTSIGEGTFEVCSSLKEVYYEGTSTEWNQIRKGMYNDELTSASRYYYSETKPTTSGNYWHYVDGVVTKWGI